MNYLYLYDPHTKEYAGKTIKQLNTVATENKGKPVYFTVPNSTDIEPPQLNTPGVAFCFNKTINDWVPVDDNRNRMVINTETKEISLYPLLGEIKPPYTTDIPSNFAINFVTYDNGQWKLTDRKMVLDNIWDLRKRIRDEKCKAPVEYHGHLFKCNRVSINDMLTALEEIRLTNDLSNAISWCAVDSENVTLSGIDIQNILKLYRQRRGALVSQSMNAWKEDELRSDADLLAIFEELSNLV